MRLHRAELLQNSARQSIVAPSCHSRALARPHHLPRRAGRRSAPQCLGHGRESRHRVTVGAHRAARGGRSSTASTRTSRTSSEVGPDNARNEVFSTNWLGAGAQQDFGSAVPDPRARPRLARAVHDPKTTAIRRCCSTSRRNRAVPLVDRMRAARSPRRSRRAGRLRAPRLLRLIFTSTARLAGDPALGPAARGAARLRRATSPRRRSRTTSRSRSTTRRASSPPDSRRACITHRGERRFTTPSRSAITRRSTTATSTRSSARVTLTPVTEPRHSRSPRGDARRGPRRAQDHERVALLRHADAAAMTAIWTRRERDDCADPRPRTDSSSRCAARATRSWAAPNGSTAPMDSPTRSSDRRRRTDHPLRRRLLFDFIAYSATAPARRQHRLPHAIARPARPLRPQAASDLRVCAIAHVGSPSSALRAPSPRKRGEGRSSPLAPLAGRGWREAPGEGPHLLVPQRFDRIQPRRLVRRVDPEEQADRDRDAEADDDRPERRRRSARGLERADDRGDAAGRRRRRSRRRCRRASSPR